MFKVSNPAPYGDKAQPTKTFEKWDDASAYAGKLSGDPKTKGNLYVRQSGHHTPDPKHGIDGYGTVASASRINGKFKWQNH